MKTKLLVKLIAVLSLCLMVLFAFTACKDDDVYAGSDDFQSYPDYWNDFNNNGDIVIPNSSDTTSGGSQDSDTTDTPSENPNANFTDEDDDDTTSNETDTDNDSIPDTKDPDDDNDGIPDEKDPDDDGDGVDDDKEKPDYGNQGPLVFF